RSLTFELYGPLAPLAMIGLGEVGQLEVDCEGFGELVCMRNGGLGDQFSRKLSELLLIGIVCAGTAGSGLRIRVLYCKEPKPLYVLEQGLSALLLQDLAQKTGERPYVAAKRRLLQLGCICDQLGESRRLVFSFPEFWFLRHGQFLK